MKFMKARSWNVRFFFKHNRYRAYFEANDKTNTIQGHFRVSIFQIAINFFLQLSATNRWLFWMQKRQEFSENKGFVAMRCFALWEINPFLAKTWFSTKIYGFSRIFFRSKWIKIILDMIHGTLTPIGNILGPSPSVIFGNKIQKKFFENFRKLWRHTLQLDSDVICGSEGTS